jgi:hypothetical protein
VHNCSAERVRLGQMLLRIIPAGCQISHFPPPDSGNGVTVSASDASA